MPGTPGTPLGPGGRPFRGLRWMAWMLALGALFVNGLLLFSDRAPGLLRRLSERIDAGSSRAARAASEARLPESDTEVHVVVWAIAMFLVGLGMWSWRSLRVATVLLLAATVVIELAQERLTDTRLAQTDDMVANAIGIGLGLGGVVAVVVLWRLVQLVARVGR